MSRLLADRAVIGEVALLRVDGAVLEHHDTVLVVRRRHHVLVRVAPLKVRNCSY